MEYRVGDKVRVIKDTMYCHQVPIRNIVEITDILADDKISVNYNHQTLHPDDIELVEEKYEFSTMGQLLTEATVSDYAINYQRAQDLFNEGSGIRKQSWANKIFKHKKTMGVIKKAFQSKESKAVCELGLGENSKELNQDGLMEFVQYLYETSDSKKEFLAKLVEANKKD